MGHRDDVRGGAARAELLTAPPPGARVPASGAFLAFGAFSFALFGALLVLVGASQDRLAQSLGLDLAQTGLAGSALVGGIGVGVLLAGPLADRLDRRRLLIFAAGGTALALCGLGTGAGFGRVLVHIFLAGLGGGVYETVLNTETIERFGARSVRTVGLLHASATLGAMATPLFVGWLPAATGWPQVFRLCGAAHGLLACLALLPAIGLARPDRAAGTGALESEPARLLTPVLAALCLASFAYIGVESAITVFAIPYATDALGLDAGRGRTAISTFWLGLLAGRLAFSVLPRTEDARWAAAAGAAATLVLGAGVGLAWTAFEAMLTAFGFVLGGVFPLLVALAGRRTPHAPGSAVGLVAGLGSLGGFAIPAITGFVGDRAGIGFAVGALSSWCFVLTVAALGAERASRRATR